MSDQGPSTYSGFANDAIVNRNHLLQINNNSDTIDRISQIITPQVTNNSFVNDFFNGASFP